MYVACPSCQSLFQVQPAHLRAAAGEVRCGMCGNRFNASAAVFEDAQQALDRARPEVAREIDDLVNQALGQLRDADGSTRADNHDDTAQALPQEDTARTADEDAANGERRLDEQRPVAGPQPAPYRARPVQADADFYAQPRQEEYSHRGRASNDAHTAVPPALLFADDGRGAEPGTHWVATLAALFLTLLLVAQYAFVERHSLASNLNLRPALEVFCELLRCDLPLRRDVGKMEMVEREVRDHPNVTGALLINAAFVNRAAFAQAYPLLQISFSDVSGTPVALRRFRPDEYLDAATDASAGMTPGETARLMLEVVDPGDRTVSFQFDFL